MIFAKTISKKVKKFNLRRKQNAIARKQFAEFRSLVDASKRFNISIRDILYSLRAHYKNNIKSSLAKHTLSYDGYEINNCFICIEKELSESNMTFRDLSFIMTNFEGVLNFYKRYLKIIEVFVHEIASLTGKPIAKGIEAEYESFREKYNYFVKDFKDYCRKVNQELGEREFPEWAIDHIKKW